MTTSTVSARSLGACTGTWSDFCVELLFSGSSDFFLKISDESSSHVLSVLEVWLRCGLFSHEILLLCCVHVWENHNIMPILLHVHVSTRIRIRFIAYHVTDLWHVYLQMSAKAFISFVYFRAMNGDQKRCSSIESSYDHMWWWWSKVLLQFDWRTWAGIIGRYWDIHDPFT